MPDNKRKLWEGLNKDGLYTKSYEEFTKQFSTPEKMRVLHTALSQDKYYTKSVGDFEKQYFPIEKNYLHIEDARETDNVTGEPVSHKTRLHSKIDYDLAKKIVDKAKKHGINPYTALAMAFQETGLKEEYSDNPFHLLAGERLNPETAEEDIIDLSMLTMQDKQKLAERLGKKSEEEVIQAWNGYGKITKDSFGREVKRAYGIDISDKPLDMSKNPVYGKRVIDIRDNILKKNPEIIKLVEDITPLI